MQILWKLFTIFVALIGIFFTAFGGYIIFQSNTTTFITIVWLSFSLLLWGSISIIWYCIFTGKCKVKKAKPYISKESQKLMETLALVDISHIESVIAIPKIGEMFTLKTDNMKRLFVYITTLMKKTEFEPEELRWAFIHVSTYIRSSVSVEEFDSIKAKWERFVTGGGKLIIEKK